MSAINSPTHALARYLATKLRPLSGNTDSYIRDSCDFVNKIKSLRLCEGDILVSFDVVSLFTKVPVDGVLEILRDKLPTDINQLVEICLKNTFFSWNGNLYEQVEGAAMGSPLSPVIANIYMEDFETKALAAADLKPKSWFRYVDDTFVVWSHGRQTLEQFLVHLNSVHNNIQFTMEVEENGSIPFLDVHVTRKPDGSLGHAVYRKKTHTDRYLNANSHHHPMQKATVLKTLTTRAVRISDAEHLQQEKTHLLMSLLQNGYTATEIHRAIRNAEQPKAKEELAPPEGLAFLPYSKGITDKIGHVLRRYSIKTVFRTNETLGNGFRSAKDQISNLKSAGIYNIPCSCGSNYIGQTGRSIELRLREHKGDCKHKRITKSAVAEHTGLTGHKMDFDNARVLARVPHYFPRIIREAIEIEKQPNNINREDGFRLSKAWTPVVYPLRTRKHHRSHDHAPPDLSLPNGDSQPELRRSARLAQRGLNTSASRI